MQSLSICNDYRHILSYSQLNIMYFPNKKWRRFRAFLPWNSLFTETYRLPVWIVLRVRSYIESIVVFCRTIETLANNIHWRLILDDILGADFHNEVSRSGMKLSLIRRAIRQFYVITRHCAASLHLCFKCVPFEYYKFINQSEQRNLFLQSFETICQEMRYLFIPSKCKCMNYFLTEKYLRITLVVK